MSMRTKFHGNFPQWECVFPEKERTAVKTVLIELSN